MKLLLLTDEEHATLKLLVGDALANPDSKIQALIEKIVEAREVVDFGRRPSSAAALGEGGGLNDEQPRSSARRPQESSFPREYRDAGIEPAPFERDACEEAPPQEGQRDGARPRGLNRLLGDAGFERHRARRFWW